MVLRTFFAFDNDNLVVTSSSSTGIVGNGIINNSDTPNGTIFTYSAGGGTSVTIDDTNRFADNIAGDNNLFFNDDDRFNHTVTNGGGIVGNGSLVDAESTILLRALDSAGNPTGPQIEITVFSQNNNFQDVWGFGSDTPLVDGVSYIKVGGDNDGTVRYTDFITCFEARTKIKVQSGLKAAEDITIGDLVWTRDSGYQPVRWIGKTTVAATGAFAPVVIQPGAIGNAEELVVSPEHRILLSSASAELLFGENEVFVAAKHLCGLPGVFQRPGGTITYVHFMCDTHQIVSANGIDCESFFLSEFSVSGVDADQRRELLALFPSLEAGMQQFGSTAAKSLRGYEANLFCNYLQAGNSGR